MLDFLCAYRIASRGQTRLGKDGLDVESGAASCGVQFVAHASAVRCIGAVGVLRSSNLVGSSTDIRSDKTTKHDGS